MTDPFSEDLTRLILSELGGIRRVDGYYHDIARVDRYDRRKTSYEPKPCIQAWRSGEQKTLSGWGYDATLSLTIRGLIGGADLIPSDETVDEHVAWLADDIERVLLELFDPDPASPFIDQIKGADIQRLETVPIHEVTDRDVHDGVEVRATIGYRHNRVSTRLPIP